MKKVLVVKLSSMGDVISALPAVSDAQKFMPDTLFNWVVEENFTQIASWHPAVKTVIPFALRRWRKNLFSRLTFREIKNFYRTLQLEKYDYIIDLQGLIKSAIVAKLAIGKSFGFDQASIREKFASYGYDKKISIAQNLHTVERMRQLFAKVFNYPLPITEPDYHIDKSKLPPSPNHGPKYLVFVHNASRAEKCWPKEKWIKLARLASDAGFKIKLLWGNLNELAGAKHIAHDNNKVIVLPKLTLPQVAIELLNAQGVVAVDTGLGHLSTAFNIPTISLYGKTNPKLVGTYGKNTLHLTQMQNLSAQIVWEQTKNLVGV